MAGTATIKNREIKKRKVNPKTDEQKQLKQLRKQLPAHVVEVELKISSSRLKKIMKTNEHLRVIRNTILGQIKKNYEQMIRTKRYKRTNKQYKAVCTEIAAVQKQLNRLNELLETKKTETSIQRKMWREELSSNKKTLKGLEANKKEIGNLYEELKKDYNVTFEFVRKYGEELRRDYFKLPDSVCVLSVCDNVWKSIEKLMSRDSNKVRFYKKGEWTSFQGKQAEKSIILKQSSKGTFFVKFMGMNLPLKVKKNDLFVEETLANISHYIHNKENIEQENVKRFLDKQPLKDTFRVLNNRIILKEIRGKIRVFVQIVLEGNAVPKRKKDGSYKHQLGTGRVAADIGTQSVAIVSEKRVILKNLAERSPNAFKTERKIVLLQRRQDRSRRAMNPDNFDEKGRIKKGPKTWTFSKRYKRRARFLRNLHRVAACNREYAHNQDINYIRSFGDSFIVEQMNIKALQKKAKEATKNEKTGKWNRRKRFGKSILKRSPGYFIKQANYRFGVTGGFFKEVDTWSFKASQYDHMLNNANKKQLSQRWHRFSDGTKVQRDLYSAFLLYCSKDDFKTPDVLKCNNYFASFLILHNECIEKIKNDRKVVLNSGIKF